MTNKPLVVIVDDEVELRENMIDLLELEGYDVNAFETGDLALAYFEAKVPDLILLDIQLPGTNGTEVLRIMKEKHPALPILMVSASSDKETRDLIDAYGADGFMLKPYDQDKLLEVMKSLLGQENS